MSKHIPMYHIHRHKEEAANMAFIYFLVLACAMTAAGVQGETHVVDMSPLVNCSDASSMLRLQQKCFDLYDVPVTLPDADHLTNITIQPVDQIRYIMGLQDPDMAEKLCKNIDNYVKSFLCTGLIGRKCTQDFPVLQALYPPEDKIRKQQEYICANIHNYNFSCVNDKMVDIAECVNVTSLVSIDPFNGNISDTIENIYCVTFEVAKVCARKYIKSCGELSLQLYEVGQPDTSSVCKTSSVAIHEVDTGVDCSDQSSIRRGYLTCLMDNGITLLVPHFDTSEDTSASILQAMTLSHNKDMCSNLDKYKDAINCTLELQRRCSDDLMKPTVPDPQTVQQGFDGLCKHIGDFNTACVVKATDSACAARKRRSFAEQIILRHLCDDDDFRQKCMLSMTGSCGARTVSMYKQVLKSQSPAKCLKQRLHAPVIG